MRFLGVVLFFGSHVGIEWGHEINCCNGELYLIVRVFFVEVMRKQGTISSLPVYSQKPFGMRSYIGTGKGIYVTVGNQRLLLCFSGLKVEGFKLEWGGCLWLWWCIASGRKGINEFFKINFEMFLLLLGMLRTTFKPKVSIGRLREILWICRFVKLGELMKGCYCIAKGMPLCSLFS